MSRLTLVAMSIGLLLAGSAFANDGTMLIYDLTELGRKTPVSTGSEMFEGHGAPQQGMSPRTSPAGQTDLTIDWSAGNLELNRKDRNPSSRAGSGFQNTQPNNDDDQRPNGATPTPEPGTMLLMGSGLAAGARYLRRRRNTNA